MEQNPFNNHDADDKPKKEKSGDSESSSSSSESSTGSRRRLFRRMPIEEAVVAPTVAPKSAEKAAEKAADKASEKSTDQPAEGEPEVESAESLAPLSEAEAEQHESTPTQQEVEFANQQIAGEHYEAAQPLTGEAAEELSEAVEFLDEVRETGDPEAAFEHRLAAMGYEDDEIAELTAQPVEVAPDPIEYDTGLTEEQEAEAQADAAAPTRPVAVAASSTAPIAAGPTPVHRSSAVSAPNAMPRAATEYYDNRRNRAGELLVVGLVGYFVGRRRGRIKTEKKLIPVQKKLERQVKSLEENITIKEQQLVAAKARMVERHKPSSTVEKPVAVQPAARVERPAPTEQRMQPGRKESRLDLQKPTRAEHLGHMIVAAEAPKAVEKVVERKVFEKPNNIREAYRPEYVKTMPKAELLEISEKIIVEGAPLRRIYESRLIGERQLRHLVSEHLQGKDITKDLRKEMIEHEIDFERDPIMRDRARSATGAADGGGTALSDLLAKAGVKQDDPRQAMQERMQREADRKAAREHKLKQQRVTTDIAMVTAVVVLAVAVVILALTR